MSLDGQAEKRLEFLFWDSWDEMIWDLGSVFNPPLEMLAHDAHHQLYTFWAVL